MIVKAKFKCNAVTSFEHSKRAEFYAVYGTDGENSDFSKATPAGVLDLTIDESTPAINFFQPGKNYSLTLEESSE